MSNFSSVCPSGNHIIDCGLDDMPVFLETEEDVISYCDNRGLTEGEKEECLETFKLTGYLKI